MKRAFIMVLDSFGIGATEDAIRTATSTDTLGHIAEACAKGGAGPTARKGPLNYRA